MRFHMRCFGFNRAPEKKGHALMNQPYSISFLRMCIVTD
jgi:hypothetical protein